MQYRWIGKYGWGLLGLSLLGCGSGGGDIKSRIGAAADGGSTENAADAGPWSNSNGPKLVLDKPAALDAGIDPDGDGLSSEYEFAHGSDPERADTDNDGVSDLAETVADTDPNDPKSLPSARGDFYFVTPYQETPTPELETLQFDTTLHSADLFILVDTTGSMGAVLAVLQQKLSSEIVPQAVKLIDDLHIGLGSFQDLSASPYGSLGDVPLVMLQTPTASADKVQAAVSALVLAGGGDGPEGGVLALYALATGHGFENFMAPAQPCDARGIGYACFRPDAVPIVLLISDAEFHNGPNGENPYTVQPAVPDYQATLKELRAIHARVISIQMASNPDYGTAPPIAAVEPVGGTAAPVTPAPAPAPVIDPVKSQMQTLSRDTGAVTSAGEPLYFQIDGSASTLDARVVDAVRAVAERVPFEVSTVVRDDPSDDVDATKLIDRIEVHRGSDKTADGRSCSVGLASRDRNADGADDTFTAVEPGKPVCFDVKPHVNQSVMPRDKPAVFRAFIDVVADGKTVLDTREIHFLIPAATPVLE